MYIVLYQDFEEKIPKAFTGRSAGETYPTCYSLWGMNKKENLAFLLKGIPFYNWDGKI